MNSAAERTVWPVSRGPRDMQALEHQLRALCELVHHLAGCDASESASSREARLQHEVLAERRAEAIRLLSDSRDEPAELRRGRLVKMLEALGCSRDFFRAVCRRTS